MEGCCSLTKGPVLRRAVLKVGLPHEPDTLHSIIQLQGMQVLALPEFRARTMNSAMFSWDSTFLRASLCRDTRIYV